MSGERLHINSSLKKHKSEESYSARHCEEIGLALSFGNVSKKTNKRTKKA